MDRIALDTAILRAHANGDRAALAALYAEVADQEEAEGQIDAACFFLTQALVFALEEGIDAAQELQSRLVRYGRA